MPTLIEVVQNSEGPVLELGAGVFSTPLLHWLCFEKRKLVTYEHSKRFYEEAARYRTPEHDVILTDNYNEIDIKQHWGVVFVDHLAECRLRDVLLLKDSADFIVIHDTEEPYYKFSDAWPHFKFVSHWKKEMPWTSVVSNFKQIEK